MIGDDAASHLPVVTIYTDGACNPNPGPGGWAAVLLATNQPAKELVGSELDTTNNRMELCAAIEALAALSGPHRIHLHTDSEYLRRGITEWVDAWEQQNWKTARRTNVKNQDLWRRLVENIKRHRITWHWVMGHAGNRWNQVADTLARRALAQVRKTRSASHPTRTWVGKKTAREL
jgi:ribonuclease HI